MSRAPLDMFLEMTVPLLCSTATLTLALPTLHVLRLHSPTRTRVRAKDAQAGLPSADLAGPSGFAEHTTLRLIHRLLLRQVVAAETLAAVLGASVLVGELLAGGGAGAGGDGLVGVVGPVGEGAGGEGVDVAAEGGPGLGDGGGGAGGG